MAVTRSSSPEDAVEPARDARPCQRARGDGIPIEYNRLPLRSSRIWWAERSNMHANGSCPRRVTRRSARDCVRARLGDRPGRQRVTSRARARVARRDPRREQGRQRRFGRAGCRRCCRGSSRRRTRRDLPRVDGWISSGWRVGFRRWNCAGSPQVPATVRGSLLHAQLRLRQLSGDGEPWRERPPRWPRAWQRERSKQVVAHATVSTLAAAA
jgi:hypothetical protein